MAAITGGLLGVAGILTALAKIAYPALIMGAITTATGVGFFRAARDVDGSLDDIALRPSLS